MNWSCDRELFQKFSVIRLRFTSRSNLTRINKRPSKKNRYQDSDFFI